MLSRYIDITLGPLLLRLTFGGTMLIAHGMPKVLNFSTLSNNFPDPLGVSPKLSLSLTIFSEVICSVLVVLGVKVRLSAIPLIITMAVAAFIIHAGEPWSKQELASMYLFGFTTLFLLGPGKFALKK